MPLTKIWWMTRSELQHAAYLLTTNVCRREHSDYQVRLTNQSRRTIASDVLKNYPQFSESALGLVARAIRSLNVSVYDLLYWYPPEHRRSSASRVELLDISVSVAPVGPGSAREIEGLQIHISDQRATCQYRNEAYTGDSFDFPLLDEDSDAFQLAVHSICQALWGSSSLPPLPGPLQVPIHVWGKTRYVLLSEIPELSRRAFARHLMQLQRPAIPTQRKEDCAFAKDWEDFLYGEVRYEVGYVPNLRLPMRYG